MVVEAIESVIAQSYNATQIIVIDDGSQDDTAKRVAEFENVEYIYQERKGQAAARNLGLTHAKGKYIASLDSDDIWDADFLKVAVDAVERFELDFVFLNWRDFSEGEYRSNNFNSIKELRRDKSNSHEEWSQLSPGMVRTLFVKTCAAPTSAWLIRRSSLFSCWNEEMKIADDWYLILEMVLMRPCKAAYTHFPHWTKRVQSDNICHGRDAIEVIQELGLHDERVFLRDFHGLLSSQEKAVVKRRLSKNQFYFGYLMIKRKGFSFERLEFIARAFTLAPVAAISHFVELSFNHLKRGRLLARGRKR
jgi:glycosyltransferase involved in cell wall biosynthesis